MLTVISIMYHAPLFQLFTHNMAALIQVLCCNSGSLKFCYSLPQKLVLQCQLLHAVVMGKIGPWNCYCLFQSISCCGHTSTTSWPKPLSPYYLKHPNPNLWELPRLPRWMYQARISSALSVVLVTQPLLVYSKIWLCFGWILSLQVGRFWWFE